MNYHREYGGCYTLEINKNEDYYSNFNNKIEFDCARSAIQYIIRNNNYFRVWLPIYNCPTVFDRIKNEKCEVLNYNINNMFLPNLKKEEIREGDLFIWINYWGCMKNETIEHVINDFSINGADFLLDNSMAFFSSPKQNALNIYSCRKFFGVADGAYLIGENSCNIFLKQSYMYKNYLFLLKAIESGSNSAYSDYLSNEQLFNERNEPFEISKISKQLLKSIDYEKIKKTRKNNFCVLNSILGNNGLDMDFYTESPYAFPYLCKYVDLRKRLVEKNIYVSQHWKHIMKDKYSNDFEKMLASRIIPLPIDQRYDVKDMEYIASVVHELDK